MTRDQQLREMARACADHLNRDDVVFVATVTLEHPERMVAYLNAGHRTEWTHAEFAAFALQCAKRVRAGGPA